MKPDEFNSRGQEFAPLPDEFRGSVKASGRRRTPGEAMPAAGEKMPDVRKTRKKRRQRAQAVLRLTAATVITAGAILAAGPVELSPIVVPTPTPTVVVTATPTPTPTPTPTSTPTPEPTPAYEEPSADVTFIG
ncbi:MAG: hypothetical protein K6F61_08510, partial [Clostridiales bacterium]|nr:hypothetical protein [Clostridiales bacterium]